MEAKPDAQLAVIGSGDTEEKLLSAWAKDNCNNVHWLGYMGEERYDVYRQSKMVLYPTPYKYSHFSIGPVECMACGCPMVAFDLDVMNTESVTGCKLADDTDDFEFLINMMLDDKALLNMLSKMAIEYARTWDWNVRAPKILKEIGDKLR
jgi:glycosyltransferase involved in cell wall biosynthesis